MTDLAPALSKLSLSGRRTLVRVASAIELVSTMLTRAGCDGDTAVAVAHHLADADLSGVESHGIVRVLQYVEQFESGYLKAGANPVVRQDDRGMQFVDGDGGIGIPAMGLAMQTATAAARENGIAALPVRHVGHTGRLGAYAEIAAGVGFLTIIIGGGGRQNWRQVAPYGGRKALLPTNPYCMGFPGGERGPVVIDFATSMIAGGWLHSARAAGALVPDGSIIDKDGKPSREPSAYFEGGAILPKGGPMGYGMAVMAEMICDAMLGAASTECNWLVLAIDTHRYRAADCMQAAAEDILQELRSCPPINGFDRVQVPGERERENRARHAVAGIAVPEQTLAQIHSLALRLGVPSQRAE